MTSTSFMIGTGFMKCMPMTLSGRLVWAAMRPMGIEEVFVARITPGRQTRSSSRKSSNLISCFSVAASTTKSAAAMSLRLVLGLIRSRTASRSAAAILPFSTLRERTPATVLSPLSTNSCWMSFMMTFRPLMAATWAMPLPIWPAPMTPKTFTSMQRTSFYWGG